MNSERRRVRVDSMTSWRSSDAGRVCATPCSATRSWFAVVQPRDLVPRRFLVQSQLVDEAARERAEHAAEQQQNADFGRRALALRIVVLQDDDEHDREEREVCEAGHLAPTEVVTREYDGHRGREDERARNTAGEPDDERNERRLEDDREVQRAARGIEVHGANRLRDAEGREREARDDRKRTRRVLHRDRRGGRG